MKKKFFIGLFIAAAIGLFVFAYVVLKSNDSYTPQTNLQAPIEIPDAAILTMEEASHIEKPIVAMFYVDWCGYCRKFMPVFGKFANKYKNDYSFVVINCDNYENSKLIDDFHIVGFPSLFIIDNQINHRFSMHVAAVSDEKIMKEELDNYLTVRKNILKK